MTTASHQVLCRDPFLYISGQSPENADGETLDSLSDTCRLVWRNIKSVLASAGMTTTDLVKVTT